MAVTGKTGADALFKAVHKAVSIMVAYAPKFRAVVATMLAGGNINAAEAEVILAFLDSLATLDAALKKVANYSGLN